MIRTAIILSKHLSGRVNRDYFHVCLFFISHDAQSDKMNTELCGFSHLLLHITHLFLKAFMYLTFRTHLLMSESMGP